MLVFIFRISNLTVKVDAKYIKGMINNPDTQPNATINRWIAGILLFSFKLVHVPAAKHKGVDGLSRRPPSDDDPPEDGDHEDWLDRSYSFAMHIEHTRDKKLHSRNSATDPIRFLFLDTIEAEQPVIPRSAKAKALDLRMLKIRKYLETRERPPDITDTDLEPFIQRASAFFVLENKLWRKEAQGRHQIVVPEDRRYSIIKEAHDDLGHKGIYSVCTRLLIRFWWPMLEDDVKWYISTCHECQIHQTAKLHIPPSVPITGGLFRKAHIDTMLMPKAGGFRYIVQTHCALTAYPKFRLLRTESAQTIAAFIFEDILCRWGPITELVTDNGSAYVAALDLLASRYHVTHIRISPYNSQANGIVERRHYDVREAIMKSSEGDESCWFKHAHSVFWAERITILKSTGLSPYFMVHGIEPLFPFDLAEATYLAPISLQDEYSTTELVAWHAHQMQKQHEDLELIKEQVLKARYRSMKDFERAHLSQITDIEHEPGSLVLVRNLSVEAELSCKTKPRYLGPMIVVRKMAGGSYILAELDGSMSKLRYAAFRIIAYHVRNKTRIAVTKITGMDDEALDRMAGAEAEASDEEDIAIPQLDTLIPNTPTFATHSPHYIP